MLNLVRSRFGPRIGWFPDFCATRERHLWLAGCARTGHRRRATARPVARHSTGTLNECGILSQDHIRRAVHRGELSGTAPGAVLLVDAAGSTALSVRLRPYGTDGAEALANVLTAVFTPMVEEAAALGGFIADFAGDGIHAIFLGEPGGAATRALQAGRRIMRALDALEAFTTPDGPTKPLVRAVVGSGDVEWRLWHADLPDGAQNVAYTFIGSATAEAQRGELIAEAGMLAVGPTAQRALGDPIGGSGLDGGFVSVDVTDVHIDPVPLPGDTAPLDGWRFFPEPLLTSSMRGEFREVVSVFIELAELPEGGVGENAMTRLLRRIDDHEGYLCDVIRTGPDDDGVRALAFWGAPTGHEHDVGHALRCVARLRADIGERNVRAGVTMDTVFAGFVGTTHQESYTCVGAGVNLAARICGGTSWGEIRIDQPVAALLDDRWTYRDLGSLDYKGFREPVKTLGLTRIPAVIRSNPFDDTFVGRDGELSRLVEALEPLWDDRSAGVVALVGEAGIGKGHLIAELRRRLGTRSTPPNWLTGEANESHSRPLATLIDALEGYFGGATESDRGRRLNAFVDRLAARTPDMRQTLERAKHALGDLLEVSTDRAAASLLDPKTRFENTVGGVEDLIVALAASAPVILYVADGQWLDSGTLDVLTRIRTDLADQPVAILLDTRDAIADLPADINIDLGSLTPADITGLATTILGQPPAAELVELVMDRSAGNPFFAREILGFMHRELLFSAGPDGLEPRFNGERLPTDLRRIVIADLDVLGPDVLRTVQTASVLGREFSHDVLEVIVGSSSDLQSDVEVAIRASIIESIEDGRCRFRHSVVRDTAYGMQLHSEVRRLHIAAAQAIGTLYPGDESHVAELAYHSDRGGQTDIAIQHYADAGRVAAKRFANKEALAHVERGLELLGEGDPDLRFEMLALSRSILDRSGDRGAQANAIDEMATLADTDQRRLEVALRRGELLAARGVYDEADLIVTDALASQPAATQPAARGALRFLLAQLARNRGDTAIAGDLALTAAADIDPGDDPIHAAYIKDLLGGIAYERGDFAAAADQHQRAANALATAGDPIGEIRALNNLGTAGIRVG